jgi:Lon-like protease
MTQRTLAGLLAVPLLVALWLQVLREPLPYVVFSPGLTVDVLGTEEALGGGDDEIIQVSGAKTYRDTGELRMTTVLVSEPQAEVGLFQLLGAWIDGDDAIWPYEAQYGAEDTDESQQELGESQMASSQDAAVAAALTELGYDVDPVPTIGTVTEGAPAEGELEVGDVLLGINGQQVNTIEQAADAVDETPEGEPTEVKVRRDGEVRTFSITRKPVDGVLRLGFEMRDTFRFPVDVSFRIDDIGGPSAGLMFSLGIYDTLTEGSLTGGESVAGTGTISPDGSVGPIGGIDQKIAGARETDAGLFLVPADNCADAYDAPAGDLRLTRVATLAEAVDAIEAWVADPDADLPQCTASGAEETGDASE